ncbi:ribonuclease P 40kDa subunit-domain-containing protein [Phaeosphaeriaceae sp. PMI808]|nr:ribonuclease P 40kDa subunit-domain-containing protein [Phaeosphaeriaceae sp. PMI808]
MLDLHRPDPTSTPKVYFTHTILPSYIDPHNVSTKKQPFATIAKQPHSHTLDLILPRSLYALIAPKLPSLESHYVRLRLSLTDILSPTFLETYINHGTITLLSEPIQNTHFTLQNAILTLTLPRTTYERCGLQQTSPKNKSQSAFTLTYDLRTPALRPGKPTFTRLQWAATNVLTQHFACLFYNHVPGARKARDEGRDGLNAYAPCARAITACVTDLGACVYPVVPSTRTDTQTHDADEGLLLDILEYVHLLSLASPRVLATDGGVSRDVARYEVPDLGRGRAVGGFVRVRWEGFVVGAFVREVFLAGRGGSGDDADGDVDMAEGEGIEWFSLSAQEFGDGTGWTVMQFANGESWTWDC